MSGIFGIIGGEQPAQKVKDGLIRLNKRGGNGVGITLKCGNEFYYAGTLSAQPSTDNECTSALGITSSENTDSPACNGIYSVVADGKIENINELSRRYSDIEKGASTQEAIINLLTAESREDKKELIRKINSVIDGAPSYAFLPNDEDAIYISKGNEPVFIGISSQGTYISSEIRAMLDYCEKYILLHDGDSAKITKSKISIYDIKGKKAKRQVCAMPTSTYTESGFSLVDEIRYCPTVIKEGYKVLNKNDGLAFDQLRLGRHSLERLDRIILTGEGSSYNVAQASVYNFELLCDIETLAIRASELMQSTGIITKNTLVVAISKRGEDMATISAIKRAKYNEARTIALTSNKSSYLALCCDYVLDSADEFSIQSVDLRSFQMEYFVLSLLGIYMGFKRGFISDIHLNVTLKMAQLLSGKISASIRAQPQLVRLSNTLCQGGEIAICGYALDGAIAQEIAGKLREISGSSAYNIRPDELEGFHGNTVVAIVSNEAYIPSIKGELEGAKARGKSVIICTTESAADTFDEFENVIAFGDSISLFNPIIITSGIYRATLMISDTGTLEDAS